MIFPCSIDCLHPGAHVCKTPTLLPEHSRCSLLCARRKIMKHLHKFRLRRAANLQTALCRPRRLGFQPPVLRLASEKHRAVICVSLCPCHAAAGVAASGCLLEDPGQSGKIKSKKTCFRVSWKDSVWSLLLGIAQKRVVQYLLLMTFCLGRDNESNLPG